MLNHFFITLFFLVILWIGAGLVIKSVDNLSKKIRVSSFALSFLFLGLLTSLPELAIGLTSISEKQPEIFVGNLLGGIIAIFLLIIPALAIFGNGIKVKHRLDRPVLLIILGVILCPNLLLLDRKITNPEAIILMLLYVLSFYLMQKKYRVLSKKRTRAFSIKSYSFLDLAKVLVGSSLIFIASHFIVEEILFFSDRLAVSPFLISIMMLSIGTNLPEISLAIKSVISKKKDIAFGGYLGSATANTFLFGFLSLINNGEVATFNNFIITFCFMILGIGFFYFFSKSQDTISKQEGLLLFLGYVLFMSVELLNATI